MTSIWKSITTTLAPLQTMVVSLTCALLGACGQSPLPVEPGVSLQLAQQRAAIVSELNYQLRFAIPRQEDAAIDGHIVISFELADNSQALQLDFRESADKLKAVSSNGTASDYTFHNEHIVLPASELKRGYNRIEIEFTAGPQSLNRNPQYVYTLFVPDRARTAFPLFDQPDLKASYELTLEVPGGWKSMSNAPLATMVTNAQSSIYQFQPSDRISSYLFSFVAGEFETITREVNGRAMTMLHRESDVDKLQRNLDAIFELHAASLSWMEDYTGIAYPYQKFDFALIPTFQYGGMEHVGAIQYRADSLLLDASASDTQLLNRASLIAHETAHMWFGDLVTMRWFNDVWTKEVFANFMAAKIVNPSFPNINHQLAFLVDLYPQAYAVDRTAGANPIRQQLDNLNQAGQMYGAIIYNKAPIMMRQLEALVGAEPFRQGLQEYLRAFAFGNASWPDLIAILDQKSAQDLQAWSEVWVNTPGRPQFVEQTTAAGDTELLQVDAAATDRAWPQQFSQVTHAEHCYQQESITSVAAVTVLPAPRCEGDTRTIFNADGFGYGLFPADIENLQQWDTLVEVEKGAELINLYEQLLASNDIDVQAYFLALQDIVAREQNQLLLDLALGQLQRIYWSFMTPEQRLMRAAELEHVLWTALVASTSPGSKKIYFDAFAAIALSPAALQKVSAVWEQSLAVEQLSLAENDYIALAQLLAIKLPEQAETLLAAQQQRTSNPDNQRKLAYLLPSVAAQQSVRDDFFASLAQAENRQIEAWVLTALQNLHHPLRTADSEKYLLPSLELLEEIQVTGDIFFPKGWLDASLRNYTSASALATAQQFLRERPDYNAQLRMKIVQSADMLERAQRLRGRSENLN